MSPKSLPRAALRRAQKVTGDTWMASVHPEEEQALIEAGAIPIHARESRPTASGRRYYFYFRAPPALAHRITTARIQFSGVWARIHANAYE